MNYRNWLKLGLMAVLLITWHGSRAEGCNPSDGECVEIGKFELSMALGAGLRTTHLLDQDDIPFWALFELNYYGERFFFTSNSVGYLLFENKHHMVNALGTISFDQSYFNRWSIPEFSLSGFGRAKGKDFSNQNTAHDSPDNTTQAINFDDLEERNMSYFGGVEYAYYSDKTWYLNAQVLKGISDEHSGNEVRLAYTYPWQMDKHKFELSAGALWQDDEVLGYYYGVNAQEAPTADLIYRPASGTSSIVRFDWRRYLNKHFHLQLSLHYKWFSSAITDSPIVTESGSATGFIGGVYHF